jgi:hypothetical protein
VSQGRISELEAQASESACAEEALRRQLARVRDERNELVRLVEVQPLPSATAVASRL